MTGPSFGERQAHVKNSDVLPMEIHYLDDPAFMFLFFNPSANRQEVVGMELTFFKNNTSVCKSCVFYWWWLGVRVVHGGRECVDQLETKNFCVRASWSYPSFSRYMPPEMPVLLNR